MFGVTSSYKKLILATFAACALWLCASPAGAGLISSIRTVSGIDYAAPKSMLIGSSLRRFWHNGSIVEGSFAAGGSVKIRYVELKDGLSQSISMLMEPDVSRLMAPPMGPGAGGRMQQIIHPDPFNIEDWDTGQSGCSSAGRRKS